MNPQELGSEFQLTPFLIQRICHRNFGIGSDGILYGPILEKNAPPRLRIFNPDGSEAEKSGNGIRIFSRFLKDKGYVNGNFELQTLGGKVQVEFLDDTAQMIRIDMGQVTFESEKIPVKGPHRDVIQESLEVLGKKYQVTCLSIGNPHCVIPLPEISESLAREIGPHIENHASFPNRINLQLLKVINRKTIQIEIWERGAGYTLASGSSSCAAASAAYRLGLVDPSITVRMPGGEIQIDQTPSGQVLMTGSVTRVGQGELDSEIFDNERTDFSS